MQRPDFPRDRRVRWTPERIAYVRYLAEEQLWPARKIAHDIGLPAFRIFALCRRSKIELRGLGGRPAAPDVVHHVPIAEKHLPLLAKVAAHFQMKPRDVAIRLVDAMFETGEAFCLNLMDGD